MQMEPVVILFAGALGLVPYVLAIYGVVLLVRMSRTQEQILRKLETFEQGLRQR